MIMRNYLLMLLLVAVSSAALAQTSRGPEEIGLRLNSFEDFDFIYKKELSTEVYRRVRLLSASIQFASVDQQTLFGFNVGAAIGREKRVKLTDKLKFHHGFEPGAELGLSNSQNNNFGGSTIVTLTPFLGYVLGFQLAISDRFTLGMESIPTIRAQLNLVRDQPGIFNLNAGFNSNAIALTGVYRFIR